MTEKTWHDAVELLTPYVVRIWTPQGSGTGFLVSNSRTTSLCAVATAAHVISHAHYWEEPIRIEHQDSGDGHRQGDPTINRKTDDWVAGT